MVQFHENIDRIIHDIFNIKQTSMTDRIDDLIVVIYLIVALNFLWRNRQTIKLFKQSFPWFKIGFAISFLMVILDVISNDDAIFNIFISDPKQSELLISWISIAEESCKLLAEAMFLVGFFCCWHIVRKLNLVKY